MAFSDHLVYLLILIAISVYLWSRRKYYYITWKLNGIWGVPILGILFSIINYKKMFIAIENLMKNRTSPTVVWLGPICAFVADDAETVQKILSSAECSARTEFHNAFRDLLGDSILTSNDPKWSKHRKLLNPTFRHRVLLDFIPIFNAEADTFIKRMINLKKDQPIDISGYFVDLMLDIVMQTTMGKKMHIQDSGSQDFLKSFLDSKKIIVSRILYPWLVPSIIFRRSPLYKVQEFVKKNSLILVKSIIANRLLEHKSSTYRLKEKIKEDDDDNVNITKSKLIFIEQGVQLVNEKNLFTVDDLVNEANTLVAAGTDTTAATIYNVIMMLAIYPEIQDKVREELKALLPMKDCQLTYEDTTNMIYTEMVINETLRIIPTIALFGRKTVCDFRLTDDIVLPKGTTCVINIYHMHRDTKIWGPNAHNFDPEHFSRENMLHRPPYCFSPFAMGFRGCIGAKYAILSTKIILARILRNLRFTTDTKFEDMEFYPELVTRPTKYPKFEIFKVEE